MKRALEARWGVRESKGHPNALEDAGLAYECRFMPVFFRIFIHQYLEYGSRIVQYWASQSESMHACIRCKVYVSFTVIRSAFSSRYRSEDVCLSWERPAPVLPIRIWLVHRPQLSIVCLYLNSLTFRASGYTYTVGT